MAEMTYGEALRTTLEEEMRRDPSLMLVGEETARAEGASRVTRALLERFGAERVRMAASTESAATVEVALSAARSGTPTVAELPYADFVGCAVDRLLNQVGQLHSSSGGKLKAPLVVRTTQGGGSDNAAQPPQSLESLFLHIPGLTVALPSTPHDARGLLRTAVRDQHPVLFIEHQLLDATSGPVGEGDYLVPFGEARILREGRHATVVTISQMTLEAMRAAERVHAEGIDVEIIDLRTLVPLDMETVLRSVKKTNRAVIAHAPCRVGGWGAEVAALIQERAFDDLDAPVLRVGARHAPAASSPPREGVLLPNEDSIVEAVQTVMGRRQASAAGARRGMPAFCNLLCDSCGFCG